ncbi:MAG: putative monovalent cation/H+ antiporter subunit A [Synoicihabitans sp.]
MTLLLAILMLAATGLLAAMINPRGRVVGLFALVPAGIAIWIGTQLLALEPGEMLTVSHPWFETLGASLDFRLDGFGGMMGLLATGVGALIVFYASGYMHGHPEMGRFLLFLFGFMAAMLGVVVADNIILLFVFWELTGITSYLLIGFEHEKPETRKKALQALLVTGTAGLALLAGLVLLGQAAGTWRISEMLQLGEVVRASELYPAIIALVMLGALAKSAQVPLHFWLPNAMSAPTPVSAFLHSATMVKAGVFLLALFSPVLGGTAWWHGTLSVVGAVTLLTGAILGVVQTDLKRILAYTTLAVLGVLTLLVGVGTELALKSMVVFLLGHAFYKAALFMVAGAVDHETGTRDVRLLGGLRKVMPFTAAAAMLAAFSKAGFPPFLGFIGKEYVYKTGTALDALAPVLVAVALVGNMLLFALALKAGWHPFWAKRAESSVLGKVHEAPFSMWGPPMLLASLGLIFGLMPGWVSHTFVGPAATVIAGVPIETKLALWHGFNVPLGLSVLTIIGGLLIYRSRQIWWQRQDKVESVQGPQSVYERLMTNVVLTAKSLTRSIQQGALRHYVFVVLAATAALIWWKFIRFAGWPEWNDFGPFSVTPIFIALVVTGSAIVAAVSNSRLNTLLALGLLGLGNAVLFLYFSAPDLAITQLLVEALTLVLLVMVLHKLPDLQPRGSRWLRARDVSVSVAMGIGVTLLVWKATQVQVGETVSTTLSEWSYPLAHGRNVVNVILVDFRALDTFGEIIVLAIAALGVAMLLRKKAEPVKEESS